MQKMPLSKHFSWPILFEIFWFISAVKSLEGISLLSITRDLFKKREFQVRIRIEGTILPSSSAVWMLWISKQAIFIVTNWVLSLDGFQDFTELLRTGEFVVVFSHEFTASSALIF